MISNLSCKKVLTVGTCLALSNTTLAAGFGIFDARSLSMGGASVAVRSNDHAAFYNPALLAYSNEYEERNREGRFYFPMLVSQISESLVDIEELNGDNLDDNLSFAIAQFNADSSAVNAEAARSANAALNDIYGSLAGDDVLIDGYLGLAVSEPSRLEGGGVFVGVRVVGGGRTDVTDADRALLSAYDETLAFAATQGASGVLRPELFDANGNLIDPADSLNSTASARGAFIAEVGVAMSKEFEWFGRRIAVGFTPKVMSVETFDETNRIIEDRLGTDNSISHMSLNMDVGAAIDLSSRLRAGLAVKDVVSRRWDTGLGNRVELNPRARFGVAASLGSFNLAMDIDLNSSEPIGDEFEARDTAIGVEWDFRRRFKIRGGYRHDLEGNRDPVLSTGAGFVWGSFLVDVAYAHGGDLRGGAIQVGYAF